MFTIQIKNLTIPIYLGIYEWEKTHLRDIKLTLTGQILEESDQQSVCYEKLCRDISQYHYQRFTLIEELIEDIANMLLQKNHAIKHLKIKIKKGVVLRGLPTEVSIRKTFRR